MTLDDEIRPFEMAEVLDRVVCMDALRGLVMMPSGSCQMLLTDPPYSSGGLTRSERRARTSKKYQQSGAARRARGWRSRSPAPSGSRRSTGRRGKGRPADRPGAAHPNNAGNCQGGAFVKRPNQNDN